MGLCREVLIACVFHVSDPQKARGSRGLCMRGCVFVASVRCHAGMWRNLDIYHDGREVGGITVTCALYLVAKLSMLIRCSVNLKMHQGCGDDKTCVKHRLCRTVFYFDTASLEFLLV